MTSSTDNRVTSKIFIGVELTMDMKINLNRNPEWKQLTVVKDDTNENLLVVRYDDKEFVGKYIHSPMLTMEAVREQSKAVGTLLESFLPEYNIDALKMNLFPQIFVK